MGGQYTVSDSELGVREYTVEGGHDEALRV